MKKRIILFSMAVGCLCTNAYAYIPTYTKKSYVLSRSHIEDIKFGIDSGVSVVRLNSIVTDSKTASKPHFGFHAQAFGVYTLNKYLDLVLSIGYHAKGGIVKHIIPIVGNFHIERRLNFNYLQTSPQLNIFPGQNRQFFLIAGGYIGYLLTAKEGEGKYENNQKQGDTKIINILKEESTNKLNKWDFGVVLGGGYEFEVGLIFKLISDIGIRKINDISESPGRNFNANISLGYNFVKLFE